MIILFIIIGVVADMPTVYWIFLSVHIVWKIIEKTTAKDG